MKDKFIVFYQDKTRIHFDLSLKKQKELFDKNIFFLKNPKMKAKSVNPDNWSFDIKNNAVIDKPIEKLKQLIKKKVENPTLDAALGKVIYKEKSNNYQSQLYFVYVILVYLLFKSF